MNNPVILQNGTRLANFVKKFSRKRKVYLTIYETEFLQTPRLGGWDGGTRDIDTLYTATGSATSVHQAEPFGRGVHETPKVPVDDNHCYVTTGTFCGKESTPHIRCTQTYYDNYLKG